MAKHKARKRAPAIWESSGRTMSDQRVADVLTAVGYGRISKTAVRKWRIQDDWVSSGAGLASILEQIDEQGIIDVQSILCDDFGDFEKAADILRAVGCHSALKVVQFVERMDPKNMTLDDAVKLSQISTQQITIAATLEEKIVSKLRAIKERAAKAIDATAEPQGQTALEQALAELNARRLQS